MKKHFSALCLGMGLLLLALLAYADDYKYISSETINLTSLTAAKTTSPTYYTGANYATVDVDGEKMRFRSGVTPDWTTGAIAGVTTWCNSNRIILDGGAAVANFRAILAKGSNTTTGCTLYVTYYHRRPQ